MSDPHGQLGIGLGLLYRLSRALHRPLIIRRSFVHLYAVGCSRAEVVQLTQAKPADFERIVNYVRNLLGSSRGVGSIRLYCLGETAPAEMVRTIVPRWCDGTPCPVAWSWESRAGVVTFALTHSIRRMIVHEVAHAVLDHLSSGFPYPSGVSEGVAAAVEFRILGEAESPGLPLPGRKRQYYGDVCPAGRCMTVREVLASPCGTLVSPRDSWSCTAHGFFLLQYLDARAPGMTGRMLQTLRAEGITAPEDVYAWLTSALGLDAPELEADYSRFHCAEARSCDADAGAPG